MLKACSRTGLVSRPSASQPAVRIGFHTIRCKSPFQPVIFKSSGNVALSRAVVVYAGKTEAAKAPQYQPKNAKDAIETGLVAFNERKDYKEAVRLFEASLQMKPNDEEAMAALYNLGCAYTKLKQFKPAADSIVKAINDYNLKLSVALKDDDLAQLRERREWVEALTEVKGGLSRQTKIDLRTEARAPFRFPRVILLGGLAIGAALGLYIITLRLIRAVQGGPDAPDLEESIRNFGINTAALVGLGFFLYRDLKEKKKSVKITDREEQLSRLQVDMGSGRVLPLIRFRGQVRPIILAGSRAYVDKALKSAEPHYLNLRDRGVSVVPVVMDEPAPKAGPTELDPDAKIRALKKEFMKQQADSSKGFSKRGGEASPATSSDGEQDASSSGTDKKEAVLGGLVDADKKWRLSAYDMEEWKTWITEQRAFAKLPTDEKNCYIQVQLDGTVRTSGVGTPDWSKITEDLPLLDSLRTRFTDGVGPSI